MDQDRTKLTRLLVGLAAIIVLAILAWILFFRGSADDNKAQQTSQKTTASQDSKSTDTGSNADQRTTNQDSQTGQSNQQVAGQQLAETGPGQTVPLFVVTVVLAAALHYAYRRRAYSRVRARHN